MVDEKSIKEWYATEVKERMEDAGLKPYHMSHLCQIKHDSLHTYLSGKGLPNPWSLVLMAEHLDCCVNDLLGYDEITEVAVFERYLASQMYANEIEYAHCFAHRLERVINESTMGLEGVSERSGYNIRTIKQWLGERPKLPRTSQLLQLCEALKCTPTDILGY